MSATPFDVHVAPDASAAADVIADRFIELARRRGLVPSGADAPSGELHIAVSGGSVATSVVPALVSAGLDAGLDWSRVHVWFADERFVPRGHEDRNAVPIVDALRRASGFDPVNLHVTLSSDIVSDVAEAAHAYERDLRATVAALDLVLLGAGPDGHTASLFPGHELVTEATGRRDVVEILDSPKPPPQRLTLTLRAIHAAANVWAIVTGEGKAQAVKTALRPDVTALESPLGAALRGNTEGRFLVLDEGAASGISQDGVEAQ